MNFVCCAEATLSHTTIWWDAHITATAAARRKPLTNVYFVFILFVQFSPPFFQESRQQRRRRRWRLHRLGFLSWTNQRTNELLLTLCIHNQSRPQNLLELEKNTHSLTHSRSRRLLSCCHYYLVIYPRRSSNVGNIILSNQNAVSCPLRTVLHMAVSLCVV